LAVDLQVSTLDETKPAQLVKKRNKSRPIT
jgi:hypothetical protein